MWCWSEVGAATVSLTKSLHRRAEGCEGAGRQSRETPRSAETAKHQTPGDAEAAMTSITFKRTLKDVS